MMETKISIIKTQTLPIQSEHDIVIVRRIVREWAMQAQFSVLQQTKLMTAASELSRNIFRYASTGTVQLNLVNDNQRKGLMLTFEDKGPGIADITLAMKDGYSTGNSLGMGLSGTKRLVDQFDIHSQLGAGTTVCITIWK